jgi:hypothetical protein
MEEISTGNFICQIPKSWDYSFSDSILCVYDEDDGVGAIQISNYNLPDGYSFDLFDEFYDFLSKNISINKNDSSFYSKIINVKPDYLMIEADTTDRSFIFAMYYYCNSVLFVTYNCEKQDKSKEKEIVLSFINSVAVNSVP